MKRYLKRNLETKLARVLLDGGIGESSTITFTVQNGELTPVHAASFEKK